jgi:hypothetical protein
MGGRSASGAFCKEWQSAIVWHKWFRPRCRRRPLEGPRALSRGHRLPLWPMLALRDIPLLGSNCVALGAKRT